MKLIKTFFLLVIGLNLITAQSLTNIAVLDLEGKNVPQTEASILTDKLRGELYNTGQFQIIERARMNEILDEQGFQVGLGIGYNFTSRLGFELNVDWHSATLEGYSGKIKNYSYGNLQSEEDAILFTQFLYYGAAPESWLEGPLTSKEGTVDLTGVQVSAGLVFSF